MSPIALVALTVLLLLAMVGTVAGIALEARAEPRRAGWRNPALRDALLPLIGWASLFVLDFGVKVAGPDNLPTAFKHLLGNLALLIFYYAVLATLRLIWRSFRRVHAQIRWGRPPAWRAIPYLGRLAFPTLFVSSALAAVSVYQYDGLSRNLAFIAGILAMSGVVRRRRTDNARAEARSPP